MMTSRPWWLDDPCPVWCVGGHSEADHPDDHVHQSTTSQTIPVVFLRRRFSADRHHVARYLESADLDVVRYRYAADVQDWVFLGHGDDCLDLSLESARRLREALGMLLDEHPHQGLSDDM